MALEGGEGVNRRLFLGGGELNERSGNVCNRGDVLKYRVNKI